MKENSGIAMGLDSTIWMINDGGNKDKIYQINFKGQPLKEFKLSNAKNKDWEDIAQDQDGNLYIGDIGNNNNDRKDLVIYKISNPENEKGGHINAVKIEFRYPDQKKFPPKKKALLYDAEALFYSDGDLFIITKNRTKPFTGEALIYKIPARKGRHKAQLVASFTPCTEFTSCGITAADISPDGQTIVFLSYGTLWVFTDYTLDDFTSGKVEVIDLGVRTQLESVGFMDNSTLLLSDEERSKTGRNLYSYSLNSN